MKKAYILFIALILLAVGFGGYLLLSSSDDSNSSNQALEEQISVNEEALAGLNESERAAEIQLQQELQDTPALEPVSAEEFGDFGNPSDKDRPQNPDEATKLGDAVNRNLYQGVVFLEDNNYRIVVGKLHDVDPGTISISDTFELNISDSRDVSLDTAKPQSFKINTKKIIRWANLPDDNIMVDALLQYKANQ